MASRTPASHAAGIFSDMTVDGPEIGTLVVIVDRAKNLPNRKSIGKQDPYCAARLGKEAKKTETDKRGGQTPKWDQEMRFTVHDSPDYYQLKVSVFNDDKKTELIGETYISLKEIIVPGGGQNDIWHNLNYRGKYAGEIRMEITYYDSRPKEEKKDRTREGTPSNVDGASGRDNAGGPRVMKERVKRRPLPSDPITGQSPAMPPVPVRVGPREPRSKAQIEEESKPPVPQPQQDTQAPYTTGHLEYQQQQRYPAEQEQHGGYGTPEQYHQSSQAPYQQSQQYLPEQSPLQRVEYGTPQQGRYGQLPMDQSPMQDYNGQPPLGMARSNPSLISHHSSSSYSAPPLDVQNSQKVRELYQERYGYNQPQSDPYAQNNASSSRVSDLYNRGVADTNGGYAPQQASYNPPPSQFDAPPSPDGPPPPPPAHRIIHQSVTAASSPGYGYAPPNPVKDRLDHLRDGHRNSMPAYSNTSPVPYQAPYSTPPDVGYAPPPQAHIETAPPTIANPLPRHKLLENTYDNHYGSMQPTVEDAPPTPSPYQQTGQAQNQPQQPQYTGSLQQYEEEAPNPAPLNLGCRTSASDMNQRPSTANADVYNATDNYNAGDHRPGSSYRDQQAPPPQEWQKPDWAQGDHRSRSPAPPPVEYGQKPGYAPERSRSPAPPMGQHYGQVAYRLDDRRSRSPAPPQNNHYEDGYRSRSPAPPPVAYDQKPYGERGVSPAPTSRWQQEEAPLERPGSGYMPPLPPTLVAGLDPVIAKEISDRMYADSRLRQPHERQPVQQDSYAARDAQRRDDYARPDSSHRSQNESPSRFAHGNGYGSDRERERQGRPQSSHYSHSQNRAVSPNPIIAAAGAGRFYAQQTRAVSPAPTMHTRRAISPAPSSYKRAVSPAPSQMHTISRKSVSPAPPSRGSDEGLGRERGLNAVPFGPDDYAALNPNAPVPQQKVSADNMRPGSADPDAKIVLRDGREVDPSDHLPSSSWAALPPNLQRKKDEREARERERERSRDGRGGGPQTAAARRMERMERRERPQSYGGEGYGAPQQRNRLVRKADRMQQPVSPNLYDGRGDGRGRYDEPRGMSRAQTFDTSQQPISDREREVYGPGGRYGGGGGRNYDAPAAPPKIPLPHTNSGPPAMGGSGGVRFGMEGRDPNEAAWSLLEEMKSIDLGSGPARRRRGNHSMA